MPAHSFGRRFPAAGSAQSIAWSPRLADIVSKQIYEILGMERWWLLWRPGSKFARYLPWSEIYAFRLYKLEDRDGEAHHGTWNSQEIQASRGNRFLVEKIIRRPERSSAQYSKDKRAGCRRADKQPEWLLKRKGWPAKFPTWIPESDDEVLFKNEHQGPASTTSNIVSNSAWPTVKTHFSYHFQATHQTNCSPKSREFLSFKTV